MKKYVLLIVAFSILFAGCGKDDDPVPTTPPQSPTLSPSSVTVEEGEMKEVVISGGKSPYTATISPSGIATIVVNGTKLTVTGVKAGNAVATVKAGSDGGSVSLPISVTAKAVDPLAAFKADATPRWEVVGGTVVSSNETRYIFIADGGKLFSSNQNKWGYASLDGTTFRLIEWGTSPQIRTESGTVNISDFTIVQEKDGKVWLVFKANGSEHRVVSEKI